MTSKAINFICTISFVILCLIPLMGFIKATVSADPTKPSVTSQADDDYLFFIVDESETPLAAIPSNSSYYYVIWIVAGLICMFLLFVYTSWYLAIRKNLWELSGKVSPIERNALTAPKGFFHPIRSYRLYKEAENEVARLYSNINHLY